MGAGDTEMSESRVTNFTWTWPAEVGASVVSIARVEGRGKGIRRFRGC